jgi:hypothetical protein
MMSKLDACVKGITDMNEKVCNVERAQNEQDKTLALHEQRISELEKAS